MLKLEHFSLLPQIHMNCSRVQKKTKTTMHKSGEAYSWIIAQDPAICGLETKVCGLRELMSDVRVSIKSLIKRIYRKNYELALADE